MNKPVIDLKQECSDLKKGMEKHSAKWVGQPVTALQVKAIIEDLQTKEDAVVSANNVLIQAKVTASEAVSKHTLIADQVISLAEGIHKLEPSLLSDYNLSLPKPRKPKVAPGKTVIESLKDEEDGVGFKLKFHHLADVEGFEIERSGPQSPDLLVLAPPFTFLKVTQKLTYVDDEIIKGKRYFYRARAYNRRGKGEWSDISSRVQ